MSGPRPVRAPRGTTLNTKGWLQEAALRCLMNNLDPEVAERPDDLVVYGGTGRAARSWEAFDAIVRTLASLESDETMLVQSGKPVGVFRTHEEAPRVLIANANLVPRWANWDEFRRLDALGLTMYGQMTAGSWIYIGTQGILQGTYETFAECARQHFGGTLAGRLVVTGGLGGMGGAYLGRARTDDALSGGSVTPILRERIRRVGYRESRSAALRGSHRRRAPRPSASRRATRASSTVSSRRWTRSGRRTSTGPASGSTRCPRWDPTASRPPRRRRAG